MDKVKNISLGGFSFTIEETAYNALNTYLVEVHKHLSTNADKDEFYTTLNSVWLNCSKSK